MKGKRMKNNLNPQIYENWCVPLQQHTKPSTTITSHFLSEREADRYV